MTILNDREIKARCLKPTHVGTSKFQNTRISASKTEFFHEKDGQYISLDNGIVYNTTDMIECYHSLTVINDEITIAKNWKPMIIPFSGKLTEVGRISHGLSSFGYDATLGPKLKIAKQTNVKGLVFDPKNVDPNIFDDFEGDSFIIPPRGFALGYTNEIFDIPEDILAICMAKSTYARGALIVGVTPLEPGWAGQVTLEFSNTLDIPIKIYANEGVVQFLFFQGNSKAETPYNKRGGKYMNQEGIVLSKILR